MINMANKSKTAVVEPVQAADPKALSVVKRTILTMSGPALNAVDELVVTTPDEFQAADNLRAKVKSAKSMIAAKLDPIIKPIRSGLDALYSFRRELEKPLDEAIAVIDRKMADFKLEERRELQRQEDKRREEAKRLEDEAAVKLRLAETASTPARSKLFERQAMHILDRAEQVEAAETAVPVEANNSGSNLVKKWRLKEDGLAYFLTAVCEGKIPEDMILINTVQINALFRTSPDKVAQWPGIEIYDDINIRSRR